MPHRREPIDLASLTVENYVKEIYQIGLAEGGRPAATGRIAAVMGVSPGRWMTLNRGGGSSSIGLLIRLRMVSESLHKFKIVGVKVLLLRSGRRRSRSEKLYQKNEQVTIKEFFPTNMPQKATTQ